MKKDKIAISKSSYDVVVDYSRTLAEMVEVGKYDFVNDDITAEHFAVEGEGKHKVAVTLFHFNRYIESDEVIAEMDRQGFRPDNIEELLALGEQHPELQRMFLIVGLGSVWLNSNGKRNVPSLYENSNCNRGLDLPWFDYGWGGDYRFAGARK